MVEIVRSIGTTDSEMYLARLADQTFLNLWSYPNVYMKPGKELCDLLVVCGDHVIIFSDKTISWQKDIDLGLAWCRWYRRAVKKSSDQLLRAEQWVKNYPDRIFLDRGCKKPLPIKLPSPEKRKIHLIAVALGAHEACTEFFDGDSGSFMVVPLLKDGVHYDQASKLFAPFTIGDVNSAGTFIHVLNDITLDIIMRELDTVIDFTDYLEQKVIFIRSGYLVSAAGEEELLAYYLTHMESGSSKHSFTTPHNQPWKGNQRIGIDKGLFAGMLKNPQYIRKKTADQDSYIWDELIKAFTSTMLAGTSIMPDNGQFILAEHEIGVRCMALEPRLMRRMLASGILGLLEKSHLQDRAFRTMLPNPTIDKAGIAYVIMTLAYPKKEVVDSYEQYRKVRSNMLMTYCLSVLKKYPYVKRVVGFATEPPSTEYSSDSSEDLVTALQPEQWTEDVEASLTASLKDFDMMKEGHIKHFHSHDSEYPDSTD
ncbi:MAG: hypothetical protein KBC69_00405 [Candidatus Magasanikbacteria bacterium]|nr:hypothetical protein [Candidatus Magasanikbacteria bacterium]